MKTQHRTRTAFATAALLAQLALPAAEQPNPGPPSRPDGKPAEWLDSTQIVGAEPVTIQLPFAYNDAPGTWKITATDLIGNQTTAATVTLR